jgi:type IV secretory pathway VirB2 component (pilin)
MTCSIEVEFTSTGGTPMNLSPARRRHFRALSDSKAIFLLLLLVPATAHAQVGSSPFDTGFTAMQTLFTGTVAKVVRLIAMFLAAIGRGGGENA